MKKISLLLVIFTLAAGIVFAQAESRENAEPVSDEMLALQTANMLAQHGYRTQSPSALIGAAEILASVQVQPMGVRAERDSQEEAVVDTPEFTVTNLIADARRLAGRNRNLNSWADEVLRTYNARTRGAVGGPAFTRDVIIGGDRHTYPPLAIRPGVRTYFTLVGSGNTVLDIYAFDAAGNMIWFDETNAISKSFWINPPRMENVTIVIINRGHMPNRYELFTN